LQCAKSFGYKKHFCVALDIVLASIESGLELCHGNQEAFVPPLELVVIHTFTGESIPGNSFFMIKKFTEHSLWFEVLVVEPLQKHVQSAAPAHTLQEKQLNQK
jgi:hypothetical protein